MFINLYDLYAENYKKTLLRDIKYGKQLLHGLED